MKLLDKTTTTCPECGALCSIVPLYNDYDYSGTHCTNGSPGTHYPPDYGKPVSDCCESAIEDAEVVYLEDIPLSDI